MKILLAVVGGFITDIPFYSYEKSKSNKKKKILMKQGKNLMCFSFV